MKKIKTNNKSKLKFYFKSILMLMHIKSVFIETQALNICKKHKYTNYLLSLFIF